MGNSFGRTVLVLSSLLCVNLVRAAPAQTLGELLAGSASFRAFDKLALQAGYEPLLNSPGPDGRGYTVFAPTDEAFSKLPPKLLDALKSDPETLKKVIGYLIVPVGAPVADLNSGASRDTVEGEKVLLGTLNATTLTLTIPLGQAVPPPASTTAHVVQPDNAASNGYVHGIDNLLVPPTTYKMLEHEGLELPPDAATTIHPVVQMAPEPAKKAPIPTAGQVKLFDLLANEHRFNTLASLLKQAGLDSMLEGSEVFTVLAPTDAAFDKLSQGAMQKLTKNPDLLKKLLLYHILRGRVPSTEFQSGDLRTAEGEPVSVTVSGNTTTFNGKATIRLGGVQGANGIIHEIDAVLIPLALRKEIR